MSKQTLGVILVIAGGIGLLITFVKLYVTGFYPEELPLYGAIGAIGAGAAWLGKRLYTSGQMEG